MKNIKYTNEHIGALKIVPDFLPGPEQLAFREESTKVTIGLSRKSIRFFKTTARRYGTPYQTMIRRLLDAYAEQHEAAAPVNASMARRVPRRS
jgi:hypothetical protein